MTPQSKKQKQLHIGPVLLGLAEDLRTACLDIDKALDEIRANGGVMQEPSEQKIAAGVSTLSIVRHAMNNLAKDL